MQPVLIPNERIVNQIYVIRGRKVMLDRDLAELYGVETGALNRAVRRNHERFPSDFMFQLTAEEFETLRCQNGSSNLKSQFGISKGRGGRRYRPYVFTEHGVAMLSSVLRSEKAIQINIMIIRAFIKMREMLASHHDLRRKVEDMERKYDKNFRVVFEALKKLLDEPIKPKNPIGFQITKK
jgi:phage regulator Rha-like protein